MESISIISRIYKEKFEEFFGEIGRVSGTNIDPVFLFVFDCLNVDHYLTSSRSIDSKFHALPRYIVEIGKKLSINYILRF